MRGRQLILTLVGALLVVGGGVLLYSGVSSDDLGSGGLISSGITLLIVGVVLLFAGRYVGKVTGGVGVPSKGNFPGAGKVLSTRDTGVTLGAHSMVLAVRVAVSADGMAPYETEFKMPLGRTQWSAIQPGMVLPLLIDQNDPRKVAYDQSRPAMASASPGGQQTTTRNAADVVARGVGTHGVVQSVTPLGVTAGQVAAGLAPHEADDPVMQVTFIYIGPGDAQLSTTVGVRVPDGKGHVLVPGATIPVRYLPDDPSVATVDWARA